MDAELPLAAISNSFFPIGIYAIQWNDDWNLAIPGVSQTITEARCKFLQLEAFFLLAKRKRILGGAQTWLPAREEL